MKRRLSPAGWYGVGMRENALLQHIYAAGVAGPAGSVAIPPGDDMGGLAFGDRLVLITVDQLVEHVHFLPHPRTPLERIARKAVNRNLSDVAAMAARPRGAVVAALLHRATPDDEANALFDAMRAVAESFDCPLVGGDIAGHDGPMTLTVTVLAEPAGVEPVLRSTARVGDAVCVTGELGGSLLEDDHGCVHHLDFTPRLDAARTLADQPGIRPTAMIDLSDGLAADLPRVCDASHVSAEIDLAALPVRRVAVDHARHHGRPAWRAAVGDGEDYELLFTADPARVPTEAAGVSVTRIGTITPRGYAAVRWLDRGEPVTLDDAAGWEHRG